MSDARAVLVTGGAGFVGSNLAIRLKGAHPGWQVLAFDNLRRRGSELNLARVREAGVEFIHGDIREPEDLSAIPGRIDLLLECSAEPSVLAGSGGSPAYVVQTNLLGTFHCLERVRRDQGRMLFLSTSRVYPIRGLNEIRTEETEDRFSILDRQDVPGISARGVAEDFPLTGPRSLYGATKLASELLIEEYRDLYGVPSIVDRCGVIAGPWQMGKVDQGVFCLWMARHCFGGKLSYVGWGGTGKQVRDLLHIDDLGDLVEIQIRKFDRLDGATFNVGGGASTSLSLRETTALCEEISGRRIEIGSVPETRLADVKTYVSDIGRVSAATGWSPGRSPTDILRDIHDWIGSRKDELRPILGSE
ncbi:MAG: NAD-dependent epimerase/dehydratase family protein [Thermoanaerobaculia bacterium]